jgi:hypothetical protein
MRSCSYGAGFRQGRASTRRKLCCESPLHCPYLQHPAPHLDPMTCGTLRSADPQPFRPTRVGYDIHPLSKLLSHRAREPLNALAYQTTAPLPLPYRNRHLANVLRRHQLCAQQVMRIPGACWEACLRLSSTRARATPVISLIVSDNCRPNREGLILLHGACGKSLQHVCFIARTTNSPSVASNAPPP